VYLSRFLWRLFQHPPENLIELPLVGFHAVFASHGFAESLNTLTAPHLPHEISPVYVPIITQSQALQIKHVEFTRCL
jgi:hypothetical protein